MPITYPYLQYGGIWTASQATDAVAAGTWTQLPQLYSWGNNSNGQLYLGTTTNYSSPKQVGSTSPFIKNMSVGTNFAVHIKTNGTLWAAGQNNAGQLGLSNTTYYSSPKQVGSLTTWLTVAAGNYFAIGIQTNGTMWSWGQNGFGCLGLDNRTNYSSPKQVGSLTTWSSVTASNYRALAIKTDGTLWGWGYNTYGQLGIGTSTNYSSPKQVGSLTNWLKVVSASYSTIAIKTDGSLWTWGGNDNGQLGIGNTTWYSSPKQVGSLTTWSFISGSGNASFFGIKTDGTLWAWGSGSSGALGLGNTTKYSSPKQVGSLTTWSKIRAFNFDSVNAIKTDGTLWSWGNNNNGQLGLGNITNYSSPKQVGSATNWSLLPTGVTGSSAMATTSS